MIKYLFSFYLLFASSIAAFGQTDSVYLVLLAKASLFHLQKNYQEAIPLYEKAFELHIPGYLDAYKAASVYSLAGNAKDAFKYLELALSMGWREADWLSFDPYFEFLRTGFSPEWKRLQKRAFKLEDQYEKTLQHPLLRKEINLMTLNDQQLRYRRAQSKNDSLTRLISDEIAASDQKNLEKAKTILARYGWPKMSDIGRDGQNSFWLIVQHADADILFQKRALSEMELLKRSGELNLENYAYLYDRVQCNLNYKQIYGTQVNWVGEGMANGFRAIAREDSVDERRKSLGLSPLTYYALSYGFNYRPLAPEEAIRNDVADITFCKSLLDSARDSFVKKRFCHVEDYYVKASGVLSGMTNEENYEAACIFATIAAESRQEKYKELALDFLNLLHLRGVLKGTEFLKEPAFAVLHGEARWIDLLNSTE